jgi:adenosylhomocysteine nucleosidase
MDTADPAPIAAPVVAPVAAPILAIAAEAREFSGLLSHASSISPLPWPIAFASHILLNGQPWILAANGPGPTLAALAASTALEHSHPRAILSTGFCGALDPSIPAASIFLATSVVSGPQTFPVQGPARTPAPAHTGVLLTQDRVAISAAEKAALFARGAHTVDMEAAAVASAARAAHVPFYCVRVVSDGASDSLPLDFNKYRDSDGRFSRRRIALATILRPTVIRRLFRFDNSCRHSAILLGDFLVDCRF